MIDQPKAGAVVAASASREGRILARSILGTADSQRIAGDLDSFCAAHLGLRAEEVFFCELSVGAAFGLWLRDGRRVLLKAHPADPADRTLRFLDAVYRVQSHLFARGFPCPEPITGPLPFGRGFATVEAFVGDGESVGAHEPGVRREMARALAQSIELSAEVPNVEALSQGWTWPEDRLWPEPHNALFDFGATAAGAEWIDAFARRAKQRKPRSADRLVVGHADWSVKHFRFEEGKIRVVYDWDSLRLDKEVIIVGTAAATFPATWYLEVSSRAPSPDEMRSFVEEYEAARGEPFSGKERKATFAAAVYVMAYCARCEHAVDTVGEDLPGSFREALQRYGREYIGV